MEKKNYLYELDYVRAIAAFGIFIVHASGGFALLGEYNSKAMHIGILLNQFFRATTPVFLAISGFVLFYNYRNLQEFDMQNFFRKKIKYIIIPYVVWSIAYLLFNGFMYSIDISFDLFIQFFKRLLIGETHSHLYFIVLIFQLYILFPLLLKYLFRHMVNRPWTVLIIALVFQTILLVHNFYFRIPSQTWIINIFYMYYWKAVSVFGWFYYFLLGGILALHYSKIIDFINKNIKTIFTGYLISLAVFIGEVYYNIYITGGRDYYEKFSSLRPTNLFYATFSLGIFLWLAIRMKEKNGAFSKSVKLVSKYSFGIYFVHPMVLEFAKIKLMQISPYFIGYSRVSSLLIIICSAWIGTIGVCYFLSLFSWRGIFLGKVPVSSSNFLKRFYLIKQRA